MFTGFSRTAAAVAYRSRIAPIHAYCGPNGSGKSTVMLLDARPAVLAGTPVLSTVRILDIERPRLCDDSSCGCDKGDAGRHRAAYGNWVPWRSWQDFLDFSHGEVLADEMTGVASSADHAVLPGPVADKLMQLRRAEIHFRYTAPALSRTAKIVREVTQAVTICQGFVGHRSEGHAWVQNSAFMFLTFDAKLVTDMENHAGKAKAMVRQFTYRPVSFDMFDTFEPVYRLDTNPLGTCLSCGGRISQPRCECSTPGVQPVAGRRLMIAGSK